MRSNHPALVSAIGFLLGLAMGPVSLLCVYVRNAEGREDWPQLTGKLIVAFVVTSLPAALNGAIGAYSSNRNGSKGWAVVAYLPAALHMLVFLLAVALEPQSTIEFQLYTLLFTVVAWIAGRTGQELGCWFYRRRTPEPSPVVQDHRSPQGEITSSPP